MARCGRVSAFALACAATLASLGVADARRVIVRGNSSGGDSPKSGEMDETTFIVLMCFVSLGVVFCVFGAMSKMGISRLGRRAVQETRMRALNSLDLSPLDVGARVTLRHKGFDIDGEGEVMRATRDGRYHVRWAPNVGDTFTYKPDPRGPRVRAKRHPRGGWPRASLVPIAAPSRDALGRESPLSEADLTGRWCGAWREEVIGSNRGGDARDVAFETTFELIDVVGGVATLRRERADRGADKGAEHLSVGLSTGRAVMEMWRGRRRGGDPDAYFEGVVSDDAATMDGRWLGADGGAGTMTLRRVTDAVDVYVEVPTDGHGMPTHTHRVPSLARRVSRTFSRLSSGNGNVSAPRASARGRWRAAVAVVRAHGLVGTLRAGGGLETRARDEREDLEEEVLTDEAPAEAQVRDAMPSPNTAA